MAKLELSVLLFSILLLIPGYSGFFSSNEICDHGISSGSFGRVEDRREFVDFLVQLSFPSSEK